MIWILFFTSFLAATVIPFSSEAHLLYCINEAPQKAYWILFVATTGNWLGGITSYYLGSLGKWKWLERFFGVKKQKVQYWGSRIERNGFFWSFWTWLPFVGDLIAVGLGFFRVSKTKSFIGMYVGKALRYFLLFKFFYFVSY